MLQLSELSELLALPVPVLFHLRAQLVGCFFFFFLLRNSPFSANPTSFFQDHLNATSPMMSFLVLPSPLSHGRDPSRLSVYHIWWSGLLSYCHLPGIVMISGRVLSPLLDWDHLAVRERDHVQVHIPQGLGCFLVIG